jgi:hypothetical protein
LRSGDSWLSFQDFFLITGKGGGCGEEWGDGCGNGSIHPRGIKEF